MNVRLKKTVEWYSGLIYHDRFCVNHYNAELTMLTVSKDHEEQNIAYDRMKYWVDNVLDNSILININNPNLGTWQATESRIIPLPEEPVDQIIGIMLYLKLNAVMEGRVVISDVEILSTQGDNVTYAHSVGEGFGPFGDEGWWADSRPVWTPVHHDPNSKVVELARQPEWKEIDLDWNNSENSHRVVFADFGRDENK